MAKTYRLALILLLLTTLQLYSWNLLAADGSYWQGLESNEKLALIQGFIIGSYIGSGDSTYYHIRAVDTALIDWLDVFYSYETNLACPIWLAALCLEHPDLYSTYFKNYKAAPLKPPNKTTPGGTI